MGHGCGARVGHGVERFDRVDRLWLVELEVREGMDRDAKRFQGLDLDELALLKLCQLLLCRLLARAHSDQLDLARGSSQSVSQSVLPSSWQGAYESLGRHTGYGLCTVRWDASP